MAHGTETSERASQLAGADPGTLREHLVRHHGRRSYELADHALTAIHELEHFDGHVGLLKLDHTHG